MDEKEFYAYRLGLLPELTDGDRRRLICTYGSAREVFQAADREIRMLLGIRSDAFLKNREKTAEKERALCEAEKLEKKGIRYLPLEDRLYPERLREITGCPYALYVLGELPILTHAVAVVGARRLSPYGKQIAYDLGSALGACGVPVVSGMARGADSTAQKACLEAGGQTVAVLGCGVDVCYPAEQKRLYDRICTEGCILSEFAPETEPRPTYFPARNRIISGLSEVVAVVEAAEKSGSLITADMALEQGRDVYAVPGRIGDSNSSGCNRLIAQGAGIILSAEEFPECCGVYDGKPIRRNVGTARTGRDLIGQLTGEEQKILDHLDLYPGNILDLAENCKIEFAALQTMLTGMELRGLVTQVSTGFYHRT